MNYLFREIETLINEISSPNVSPNGTGYERARAELMAKLATNVCTEIDDLKKAIKESANSSDRLGRKVVALNWVLAAATAVGAIATVVIAFNCQ